MTSGMSGMSGMDSHAFLNYQPVLDAVTPTTFPVTGGSITIDGKGFLQGAKVRLGAKELSEVAVNNTGTRITASVPPLTKGLYGLTVSNNFQGNRLTVTVPGILQVI